MDLRPRMSIPSCIHILSARYFISLLHGQPPHPSASVDSLRGDTKTFDGTIHTPIVIGTPNGSPFLGEGQVHHVHGLKAKPSVQRVSLRRSFEPNRKSFRIGKLRAETQKSRSCSGPAPGRCTSERSEACCSKSVVIHRPVCKIKAYRYLDLLSYFSVSEYGSRP